MGVGDFTVVVTDDYLRPEVGEWNARSMISGKAWLLVKPVGMETWIGPMFLPGQTACWECLSQRLRGHRKVEEYLARRNGLSGPRRGVPACIASMQHAALAEAATEITRWIGTGGGQSILLNRVVSTSVLTLERTHHTLTRRPQCPSCGSPVPGNGFLSRPINLRQRPKAQASDGGHRALDQREVLNQLERHLSPITGIVSSLVPGERSAAACGGGRCLTPIFAADHNFSDMHDERFFLREGLRRRSGGKGKSIEQARASALAEIIGALLRRLRRNGSPHPGHVCGAWQRGNSPERLHGVQRTSIRGPAVTQPARPEPAGCPSRFGRRRDRSGFHSGRCPPNRRATCQLILLLRVPKLRSTVRPRQLYNGCAAGSVLEEAVLQGLLELIERDAVALWWYNRLRRAAVDLENVNDAYIPELIARYRELRRDVWALDVTSDIGVPTFAAISRRVDKAEEDIIYGFGAHLDPSVALGRALTELEPVIGGGADSNRLRSNPYLPRR